MQKVALEVHRKTDFLSLKAPEGAPAKILDMCMAPGSFLQQARCFNPQATARAFTLPPEVGGHKVLLSKDQNTQAEYLDIVMLAGDMGVPLESIPSTHPDAGNFLSRRFSDDEGFDLIICDGQVLRTHVRPAYREKREATRLTLTQLSIGLSHIRPGGTMLILLHRIESLKCVELLRTFSAFSTIQVVKPQALHANRSSCYLIAKNINPEHETALSAVQTWRRLWKSVTFHTEEEYEVLERSLRPDVSELLEDFGEELLKLGRPVWELQRKALAKAPYRKKL
ncbi:hypothetical protein F5Y18DRAFT_406443 [Xylariaceae sp. FL1019]|nr:hypothetical protein F5Y18DRAFT_406443 [Xylariaceae sp. FL1019]